MMGQVEQDSGFAAAFLTMPLFFYSIYSPYSSGVFRIHVLQTGILKGLLSFV
jgi:hypothetical protein